ncbi:hypothetical protein G7Z17_g3966 [Cylindrodendrum hubeiense]|uniref:Uncharacterized protein n=1 Tax=Cylindrodendrum hubeiense TaxID=595255 RepID=A0A9P5HDM7_9HYPO|nr:hypothetical protein G7Z17_g3966 [Cylindrodendrum hubeiense]
MSSNQSLSQPRGLARALIPVLSTSLNVGMALGGYVTTLSFADVEYPGPAIAVWFRGFFKPGFIAVTTLGSLTLGSGLYLSYSERQRSRTKGQTGSNTASWLALAGVAFTVFHFSYGNQVLSIMDRIAADPDSAQGHMAEWINMHVCNFHAPKL